MIHAKQHRESKKSQSEVHIKTGGHHRKMLYPPSREQASEEVADTHEAFKSKKNTVSKLQEQIPETPRSSATRVRIQAKQILQLRFFDL